MRIEQLAAEFLAVCRHQHSPATHEYYRGRLRAFREAFGPREFASLSVVEVLDHLEATGAALSETTQHHNAVAFERLQAYAIERGELQRPLLAKLSKPPIARRERIPTEDETRRLLADASPAFRSIYGALRQCGARPGELCRAKIEDIRDWQGSPAIVLEKHKTRRRTKKARAIPIGAKLDAILQAAIAGRTAGPIFLAPRGEVWTVRHLSRTYRRLRDAAGLPRGLVLYLARHEHGTKIFEAFDIKAAAEALGHASIRTTERYAHQDIKRTRRNQDAFDAGDVEPPTKPEERPPAAA